MQASEALHLPWGDTAHCPLRERMQPHTRIVSVLGREPTRASAPGSVGCCQSPAPGVSHGPAPRRADRVPHKPHRLQTDVLVAHAVVLYAAQVARPM